MIGEEEIKKIEEEYNLILEKLALPENFKNPNLLAELSAKKERLENVINFYKKRKEIENKIQETQTLLKTETDLEMLELAQDELENLEKEKERVNFLLWENFLEKDPNDGKNAILEIRAGVGGDEAALFAKDLFLMYARFAEKMGFKIEIMEESRTELEGFAKIIFKINGPKAYSYFKYEKGTHRVQRVPLTESGGRVHTSAVTVAVFPEAKESDFKINESDLKIETFRSSGPGGQHANVTASAVRITHLPTKITVVCQSERSQHQNKIKALQILKARLLEKKIAEQEEKMSKMRQIQIGTGDRSEKIRTYNFPQNRLTDHRINLTLYNLKEIMEGNLEQLIQKLNEANLKAKINLLK